MLKIAATTYELSSGGFLELFQNLQKNYEKVSPAFVKFHDNIEFLPSTKLISPSPVAPFDLSLIVC